MKIFFLGDYLIQGGPSQVNRQLLKYLPSDTLIIKSHNKLIQLIEVFIKTFISDIIIYSNPMRASIPSLCTVKILHKKCIYLMHGCIKYESNVNNCPNPVGQKIEDMSLQVSDLILCVSEPFLQWCKEQYPEYAYKMRVFTNSIEWDELPQVDTKCKKDRNLVVVMGAGRKTKKNLQVAYAIEKINTKYGRNLKLEVYGIKRDNDDTEALINTPFCEVNGLISRTEMLQKLCETSLYVQNSIFEPFGLAVVEALICGSNILISKNIGAKDVMSNLNDKDVINDPDDIDEIAEKMLYVLDNPNNKRIIQGIDRNTTSTRHAADVLLKYCKALYAGKSI